VNGLHGPRNFRQIVRSQRKQKFVLIPEISVEGRRSKTRLGGNISQRKAGTLALCYSPGCAQNVASDVVTCFRASLRSALGSLTH
jgi:hypothetical protein